MPSKYIKYENFIELLFDYMQGRNKIVVRLTFERRERKGYLDTIVAGPEDLPYAIKSVNLSKNKKVSIDNLYDLNVRGFCDLLRDNVQECNGKAESYNEKHKLEIKLNKIKPSIKYDLIFDQKTTPEWVIVRQE